MKRSRIAAGILAAVCSVTTCIFLASPNRASRHPQTGGAVKREEAYRANNLGVALMEQFKPKEAADQFRAALKIDPDLILARMNLSIALLYVPDLPSAQKEALAVFAASKDSPQASYVLALIAKTQNRYDDAIESFQRVLKIDPGDVGSNVYLGQIYLQQRKYPEAMAALKLALQYEPYNSSALYSLSQALMRSKQTEEGQRVIVRFQELRTRGSGTNLGTAYLEQGHYAEAVSSTGAEPNLVDHKTPSVTFRDATLTQLPKSNVGPASTAADGKSVLGRHFEKWDDTARVAVDAGLAATLTPIDFDGDGDLDLFWADASGQHLFRNDNGKFTDVTATAGALGSPAPGAPITAVAGDYDNDGKPDLLVVRDGSMSLYHNDGGGKFSDTTKAAGLPVYPFLPSSAAFVDVDHDGDLDIFIAGIADVSKAPKPGAVVFPDDFPGASSLLLQNDGNGKFTDISATAKVNSVGHAVAVVPTDFNNRRDVDLMVVNYESSPNLFSNQRDGSFRNVSSDTGLNVDGHWSCVAAGDVNKDGYTDFFLGKSDGPGALAISDGKEKFRIVAAPSGSEGAVAAQFIDYDNDGLLDCVVVTERGIHIFRNVGDDWVDAGQSALPADLSVKTSGARGFASADFDSDGDTDLILATGGGAPLFVQNDGGNQNNSLHVNLAGKVSNRSAIGAKIEARAGSLVQKLETCSANPAPAPSDLNFGLGKRATADAVRILWPAGIVQAETTIPSSTSASVPKGTVVLSLPVTELDRKPSSCPFLYAWNGSKFEFITDFMGGGEMGYLEEPGRYNKPDPVEYVRIRGDQLKERGGRLELRVTNELEETLFVDKLQLIAVAHPANVQVYPNAGMSDPPRKFVLYRTAGAHLPLAATDDKGHDVLDQISKMDRRYPDDFQRDEIRGYAREHTLTLKLYKPSAPSARTLLLLTGWTDYAWSSDNVAATQAGKSMKAPELQVHDRNGNWKTVIEDIGIPVGRPQTVTVDLTGKFLSADREVRIVTNMRVLWDQILVDTSSGNAPVVSTTLEPVDANLRWRGFSAEATPDGREPIGYDYEKVSFASPWKVMPGRYTREGDVRELLKTTDDMFVISRPGDEISLSFDARRLPPLPEGWTRTYLLYADGYSKEMDINSASPDQVYPLPFHGMTKYPYGSNERYPMTPDRQAYMDKYNTRLVRSAVPSIDLALLEELGGR